MAELGLMDISWFTIFLLVVLQLVGILLFRVFPSILGKSAVKYIEHQYARKLEQTKAELQASYSTLKTSVGFLSTTQAELRSKVIASTETLWGTVSAAEKEFGDIMLVDNIVLPNEVDEVLSGKSNNRFIRQTLEPYKDLQSYTEKLKRAEAIKTGSERLFVSARLWLVYSTILAVHGRFGFLMVKSLGKQQYVNWKDDHVMNSLLESCLPKTVIDGAKGKRLGGLQVAVAHLEGEFLKEAARVMSGSQGFADSLSGIHETMRYESQRMVMQRDLFADQA